MSRSQVNSLIVVLTAIALVLAAGGSPFSPPPIDAAGLHVLLVEQSEDRSKLTPDQLATLAWLPGHLEAVAPGAWRIHDADTPLDREDEWVRQAMTRERKSLPWLIVSRGMRNYEGPLPSRSDIIGMTGEAKP